MNFPLTSTFKGKYLILSKIVTTNYSFDELIEDLNVDATSGPITVTLPLISTNVGRHVSIRKIDSSGNIVTVQTAGGDLLQGSSSTTLGAQWQILSITTDGVQWHISAGDGAITNRTPPVYYVSTAASASNNNDGLSTETPFATIHKALTTLGSNQGVIQLSGGLFSAPAGGIQCLARQEIRGLGPGVTQIDGSTVTAAGVGVIEVLGSRTGVKDIWVTNVGNRTAVRVSVVRDRPVWVQNTSYVLSQLARANGKLWRCIQAGTSSNVGTGPSGSVGSTVVDSSVTWYALSVDTSTSAENVSLENVFVDGLNGSGIGFGIGDDTAYDVSEVLCTGCFSIGTFDTMGTGTSVHMQVGNASAGNVLDITNVGGGCQGVAYGCKVYGGMPVSYGMSFAVISQANIYLAKQTPGHCSFRGGRSENSYRFLISELTLSSYGAIAIADYDVQQITNTDGRAVIVRQCPIRFDNIFLSGLTCPQYIDFDLSSFVDEVNDTLLIPMIEANGINSEHPYVLGGSPWSRAGRLIRGENTKLCYDNQFEITSRFGTGKTYPVRRINRIDGTSYTIHANLYDSAEIRLAHAAGTATLRDGSFVGQKIRIVFVQDGLGGHAYTWPNTCAFDGGVIPINVLTARNRQSLEFEWNGQCWEQRGTVLNTVPVFNSAAGFTEDFSGVPPGFPTSILIRPYNVGVASSTANWETLPGGGSVGVSTTNTAIPKNIGRWVGDSGIDDTGLVGPGSGAVIETGLNGSNMTTAVSATMKWQSAEGVIVNYLDDQNFLFVWVSTQGGNAKLFAHGYANGVDTVLGSFDLGVAGWTPGTTHVINVKCTPTGFQAWADASAHWTVNLAGNAPLWVDLTKHGIFFSNISASCSLFSVS